MSDNRPAPPDRKSALIPPLAIAGVVVVIILGVLLNQAARRSAAPEPVTPPVVEPAPAPAPLPIPTAPPPLTRIELIDASNAAAAAYAAGEPKAPGKDPLVGRAFSISMPFGCAGPEAMPTSSQAYVDYDVAKRSIRIATNPVRWMTLPLIQDLREEKDFESVEGFWIPRPWLRSNDCPTQRGNPGIAAPTQPTAPTLGLVRFFGKQDSRVKQRGDRPYETVRKIPVGDPSLLGHTYRLLLEGRVVGFGNGQALRCWSESPDHRPVCLYAVEFDRVAFEDSATGEIIANWNQ